MGEKTEAAYKRIRGEHDPEPKTRLDKRGREVLDTEPARVSVHRQKMVSLSDQMRQTVLQMRHEAMQAENDSLDDEKDFDIEDDEPRSPHELFVESPEYQMFMDDIQEFARKQTPPPAGAAQDEKSSPPPGSAAPDQGNPPKAAPEPEKGKK